MKKLLLIPLALISAYFAIPVHTPVHTEPLATHVAPETYNQDVEVVNYMRDLGLDYSKLNLYYTDNPAFPDHPQASFTQPNNIYLSPTFSKDLVTVALSHEYVHYTEYKENSYNSFKSEMDRLYQTALYNRMAFYRTDYCPSKHCLSIESEAKAYSCTELADSLLSKDFVQWCNRTLPKRDLLFN